MSEKWQRDTGIVFSSLFVFLGYRGDSLFLLLALSLLLITLLVPKMLFPLAWVWLKITEILGAIVPKFVFGAVFFLVLLPVGLLRRLFVKDPLSINDTKGKDSAFVKREYSFTSKDLDMPY